MRAKRLVAMAALVALTFGSMAVAAGQEPVTRTARDVRAAAGPAVKAGIKGIEDLALNQDRRAPIMIGLREAPYRTPVLAPPPQVSGLCEIGGLVQSAAGLLGFVDLAVACQVRD